MIKTKRNNIEYLMICHNNSAGSVQERYQCTDCNGTGQVEVYQ